MLHVLHISDTVAKLLKYYDIYYGTLIILLETSLYTIDEQCTL